ncbi:MAG: glutamyl-tRNA reductase, partial [Planctomycetes bacterium]|nr:glutamyl-tRNA reductase [Planctomycetota bacterium]
LAQLRRLGATEIVVVNRSVEAARRLAGACGGRPGRFEDLAEHLQQGDVVLTSTAAPEAVISAAMLRRAQEKRGYRPMLIVDIAVPRDVEPAAGEIDNVFLYNIDDLEEIVRRNLSLRREQKSAADAIITRHVERLLANLSIREVAPTIQELYRRAEEIARQELRDARNKLSTHADAEEDVEILRRAVHRSMRRFLHPCAENLRRAAGTNAARAHIAALRKLFGLDEEQKGEDRDEKRS